ncbi:hypothetical protein [Stutzerimonas stutzeri]|uniref:hypothetical protein n=1 Tax=Stutzerimonas stutzeri TaxID=316 RepID=UPI0015E35F18|nr:hypothetical protein [Stutzerimonas stutzeri]MBA1280314.1 hypothetical protein [Stutzerimonas stutzeri]
MTDALPLSSSGKSNSVVGQQACWGAIAAFSTGCLYYSLDAYTVDLENPAPLLWGMFATHFLRMFLAVHYDRHRHSMKEVGLLSIAAVAGVWLAMILRQAFHDAVSMMLADPEFVALAVDLDEYLQVIQNKVFGIPAFFVLSYVLSTQALRYIGSKISILSYPRSTYELFGAFYDVAEYKLSHEQMETLVAETKSMIAMTQGRFKVSSPNRLLEAPPRRAAGRVGQGLVGYSEKAIHMWRAAKGGLMGGDVGDREYQDFPVRDLRRMFRILLAIEALGPCRLIELVKETGYSKQNILDGMKRASVQLGVIIDKDQTKYRLISWGPALNKDGIRELLTQSDRNG